MIFGLELTVFCYAVLAAAFALVRARHPRCALAGLVIVNAGLLFAANAVLLGYLVLQMLLAAGLYAFITLGSKPRSLNWCWLAFVGLLPITAVAATGGAARLPWLVEAQQVSMPGVFWSLGAAFFVIKSFVILREALVEPRGCLLPALAALTFPPAFSAGPIHGSAPWRIANLASVVDAKTWYLAVMRIGWGAAAFYVLAPGVKRLGALALAFPLGRIVDVYASFLALYLDFSGYTAMALALASLFGVTLPENFDQPYRATSIREFWRRWHISLSAFIGRYLYGPLVRSTGSKSLGITLAFTFAGLWHEISLRYALWGIGHGLALSVSSRRWRAWDRLTARLHPAVTASVGWLVTMTTVASISYLVQRARS